MERIEGADEQLDGADEQLDGVTRKRMSDSMERLERR